jgi:hypothetical protein
MSVLDDRVVTEINDILKAGLRQVEWGASECGGFLRSPDPGRDLDQHGRQVAL